MSKSILAALETAESFMCGFEDDEMQEGMPEMLKQIRDAIAALEKPAILGITLEGGVLQCVHSNNPEYFKDVSVVLIDFDTEGADEGSTFEVPELNGACEYPSDAHGGEFAVQPTEIDLPKVLEILSAQDAA